jgi:ABC-type transporter Mla subunit MlaD
MENMAERLLVLNDMREASISMKDSNVTLTKFMTEDLQGIFGGLKESMESSQKAMSETNSALEKTNQNLNQQKDNLDNFLDEMKNVLASQRLTFEEVSGKIKAGFEQASEKVFEQYQRFNKDMSEMGSQVKGLSKEFIEIITIGQEAFQKEVAEFEKMLDSQRGMAKEAFDDIRNLNQQSIQDIVETTKTTLIDAVGQTRDSAIGLIDSTRDTFVQVVDETNQKLQDTLNGVGDELVKTSDRVQIELKVFREEYTEALSGFFDQQKAVLEKVLGENVTALSGLVGDLREAFESEYTQKKDLMDRLQAAIASGASLTEMQKESIRELASETVKSNQKIAISLDKSGSRLDGINESLKSIASAVSEEVAGQIESFGKKQREIIETYQVQVDKHLERVLSDVVAATENLAAVQLIAREAV